MFSVEKYGHSVNMANKIMLEASSLDCKSSADFFYHVEQQKEQRHCRFWLEGHPEELDLDSAYEKWRSLDLGYKAETCCCLSVLILVIFFFSIVKPTPLLFFDSKFVIFKGLVKGR